MCGSSLVAHVCFVWLCIQHWLQIIFCAASSCITLTPLRRLAAQRERNVARRERDAAARQAAADARRTRRQSETAVKRRDLADFDPARPFEKLGWAREEMQRNFQLPMSARTMRMCTVCSERWDTAEDGGGVYRCVVFGLPACAACVWIELARCK